MKSSIIRTWLIFGIIVLLSTQCITTGEPFTGIPPGIWRGVLYLEEGNFRPDIAGTFDEQSKAEFPFKFEAVYDTPDSFHIEIISGSQRTIVNNIHFGLDRATGKDTLEMTFSPGKSIIRAFYEEDAIEGNWVLLDREDYKVPFRAVYSKDYLFTELHKEPVLDITGRWNVRLSVESDSPIDAIGEFTLDGNHLLASFSTPAETYRHLEGTVQGDRLFLSSFDGVQALLFEAKILSDGTLSGIFRNGIHEKTYWAAKPVSVD